MPCLRWQTVSASWSMVASSRPAVWPQFVPIPQYAEPISAKARPMADTSLLELRDIETSYGLSRVLFGISLTIGRGEMVSLLGRNGMGKTTTVRSIMGLTPPAAGSVRFDGEEIRSLPTYRIAKRGIGLVPEGRQIFPNLTARENLIATAANYGGTSEPWTLEKVLALFPRLAERAGTMANLLSGGEQQMLAIGRSLERLRESGQSILVIDKNVKTLTRIADRHYIIERGRVVWVGNSQELAQASAVQHRYLGI